MIALVSLCAWAAVAEVATSSISVTLTPTVAEDTMAEIVLVNGNAVLSTQVYRALVNLPENARLGPRTAARAKRDIERFLRLAGYELAEVDVSVRGRQLIVDVDEGRFERIVFVGSTGLGTLRLQLLLDLPGRVFNRPDFEEQLDRFRREEGLRISGYQIVAVRTATVARPRVPTELGGFELIPHAARYEIHVRMDEVDYPSGLGIELRGESADGVVSALRYRFAELILDNDRLEVAGLFGFRPQKAFAAADDGQRWVSRAGARLTWISPELGGSPFRLLVGGHGYWGSRARDDLGIRRYDRIDVTGGPRLRFRPSRFIELEAGGGVLLDMVTSVSGGGLVPDEVLRVVPVAFLRGELSLGDDDVRLDRRFELELDVFQVFGDEARVHVKGGLARSFDTIDYDELVVTAATALVLGERPYYALDRVGEHVKGAYGDLLYAWALGAGGVEYRLSLSREIFKLGFAYDAAVFARDLGARQTEVGFVHALSFGTHALLLDSFRLSFYVVAAWAIGETPEPGFSLSLGQVF